jgi:hypothetical protein
MASRAQSEQRDPDKGEGELGAIIRLDRYPLHRPASPAYHRLVEAAKSSLSDSGAFVLEEFLASPAVAGILDQADSMAAAAFVSRQPHNVFLLAADPAYPADHARNRLVHSEKSVLADDQIPAGSLLRQL